MDEDEVLEVHEPVLVMPISRMEATYLRYFS
jgi:hypothetical protein